MVAQLAGGAPRWNGGGSSSLKTAEIHQNRCPISRPILSAAPPRPANTPARGFRVLNPTTDIPARDGAAELIETVPEHAHRPSECSLTICEDRGMTPRGDLSVARAAFARAAAEQAIGHAIQQPHHAAVEPRGRARGSRASSPALRAGRSRRFATHRLQQATSMGESEVDVVSASTAVRAALFGRGSSVPTPEQEPVPRMPG